MARIWAQQPCNHTNSRFHSSSMPNAHTEQGISTDEKGGSGVSPFQKHLYKFHISFQKEYLHIFSTAQHLKDGPKQSNLCF